jgi:hypothetical protein
LGKDKIMIQPDTKNGPNARWGDREALREALDRPELDEFDHGPGCERSQQACRAAYSLAVALGYCRLHGLDLGEDGGVLPFEVAQAAMTRAIAGLENLVEIAGELPARAAGAADSIEIETLCLNLLRRRLEMWAAFVAIDEAYAAALHENDDCDAALPSRLVPLLDAIDRYDEALLRQLDVLSIVARIPMLAKWKDQLAAEFQMFLPWFLDGTIEQRAQEIEPQVPPVCPILKLPPKVQDYIHAPRDRIAAASTSRERLSRPVTLSWESPDGKLTARLDIPRTPTKGARQKIDVVFKPSSGCDPALVDRLLQKPAALAGVAHDVFREESGNTLAQFSLGELPGSEEFSLRVGGDDWRFQEVKNHE